MIKIENVNKSYNNQKVVKDLSLTIKKGEIHGIVGKSGAGKSTLLRMINGLEKFDSGDILVRDKSISQVPEKELRNIRKNIGIIFQNFALLNRKTVYENVAFPMKCWDYPDEKIKSQATHLLSIVGLDDKLESMPLNLSGGQKQRVAIARALALDPEILLSDESTSGLDPITTNSILNLLLSINEQFGITMAVVTHEMDVIKRICDRVSILEEGKIVATGKVEDLLSEFNPYLLKYIEDIHFNTKDDESIAKILIYSKEDQKVGFLSDLSNEIDYVLEKANVDSLKNGKLEEYYINIKSKDKDKLVTLLGAHNNINHKFID